MRSKDHLEVKARCRDWIAPLMARYRLGEPVKVIIDEAGWVNPCIFVNDAFVFRFNARDPELPKYQRESKVFELLKKSKVPVPQKVILDDTKTVAEFDVLITECLPGRNLETDWKFLSKDQQQSLAFKAGEISMELNRTEFSFFGEISGMGPLPKTQTWLEYLEAKLNFLLLKAEELKIFNESSQKRFLSLLTNSQPLLNKVTKAQLVHVDYHLGNLLYQQNEITGVFDFEWAFAGDPLYDFCQWVQSEDPWPGSREAFLKGAKKENFTQEELQRIALYQMIRNIELCVVARLHFDVSEAEDYKKTTLEQAQRL